MPSIQEIEAYIRQAAQKRGIDPSTAVGVAKSEGLAPGVWQSNMSLNGEREKSYGPFQLFVGGGLGNEFTKETGKSPADPSTVYQQVDFALDHAAKGGWGPWHGAARVGIGDRQGLDGARSAGISSEAPPQLFGSMAPMPTGNSGQSEPTSFAPPSTIEAPVIAPMPMPTGTVGLAQLLQELLQQRLG